MTIALRGFAALLAFFALAAAQNPLQTIRGAQQGESFGRAVSPYPDADGDGVLDLAVGHVRGVRIVSSASGATLREIQRARGGIGDVNGDGWPDFWAPVLDPTSGLWTQTDVLSGLDGALLAEWPWVWDTSGLSITVWYEPVALDDVDGDGIDDFVRSEIRSTGPGSWEYFLAVVSGASAIELHSQTAGSLYSSFAVLNDVDNDGVRDLYLVRSSGGPLVISGASGATLASPPPTIATYWTLTVDDLDGDGVEDLALLDASVSPIVSTQIVSTMTSAVLATLPGLVRGSHDTRAVWGDFDGDGQLDIVLGDAQDARTDVRTIATGALVLSVEALTGGVLHAPDSNANGREELWLGLSGAQSSTGKLVRIENSYSEAVGTAFAFGDGSSGPCPCAPGSATGGCGNSLGVGARLEAWGSNSVLERDLLLRVSGQSVDFASLLSHAFLITSASTVATPTPFSGGLLALAPPVQRIASSRFGCFDAPSLAAWNTWAPAQTLHFQVWYREMSPSSACGLTGNLTNALSITLAP
jgi:hypothetical protein